MAETLLHVLEMFPMGCDAALMPLSWRVRSRPSRLGRSECDDRRSTCERCVLQGRTRCRRHSHMHVMPCDACRLSVVFDALWSVVRASSLSDRRSRHVSFTHG